MGLSFMRKPPGSSVPAAPVDASGVTCWARIVLILIAVQITMMATASAVLASGFQEKSAELWLGGDVNLGDGRREQLQSISGIVQGSTGIVNLEGPVAQRSQLLTQKLRLWNAPKALDELLALHVQVAGIANNHSGDAGKNGQQKSAERLKHQGILPAGGPAGAALLHINGFVIAVMAHDLTHGVPPRLAADLAAARQQADVLIATFHVTGPASYLPRPELRRAVEIAYKAGASVIAAHGTHALGPVERREHAVIVWGLGNLAFACDCTQEQDAIILRVRVAPGGAIKADVIPIQAGLNQRPALPAKDAKGIFDLLEAIGSSRLQRQGSFASF
jgi:poly-gamma-glutamate synthesis protein (capsule biosynthesis protein)